VNTKICTKCKIEKTIENFTKDKDEKDGLDIWCKHCKKEHKKIYYQNNKELISKKIKQYIKLNPEKVKNRQRLAYQRRVEKTPDYHKEQYIKNKDKIYAYQKINREKIAAYERLRRRKDINYKLKRYLRTRLWQALKGNPKIVTTMKLIGCSIKQLKNHLEKKFTKGMTFKNYGKWHIDHIKPCASFDLSKASEQRKCFHYSNLQPLWAKDNLEKHDKI
jgi:thiol-disulfide isomerase/thioredoxin